MMETVNSKIGLEVTIRVHLIGLNLVDLDIVDLLVDPNQNTI